MNYVIRKKERKDCVGVAHVVTVAWNETYRGIVPDEFLDNLYKNEKERGKKSFDKFDESENHQYVFYKHIGGKYIKTRIFEKLQLPENVYYFDKI